MGERLLVLVLSERVDRSELLAPALEALQAPLQRLALIVAQRLRGGVRLELELAGEAPEDLLGFGGLVQ